MVADGDLHTFVYLLSTLVIIGASKGKMALSCTSITDQAEGQGKLSIDQRFLSQSSVVSVIRNKGAIIRSVDRNRVNLRLFWSRYVRLL